MGSRSPIDYLIQYEEINLEDINIEQLQQMKHNLLEELEHQTGEFHEYKKMNTYIEEFNNNLVSHNKHLKNNIWKQINNNDNKNIGYCYHTNNDFEQTIIEQNIQKKTHHKDDLKLKLLSRNDLELKFFKNIFKDDINIRSREKQDTNKIGLLTDYQVSRLSNLNTDIKNEISKLDEKISRIKNYLKDPIKSSDDITLILDKISNLFISDTNINEQKALSIYKDAQNTVKDNKSTYKLIEMKLVNEYII